MSGTILLYLEKTKSKYKNYFNYLTHLVKIKIILFIRKNKYSTQFNLTLNQFLSFVFLSQKKVCCISNLATTNKSNFKGH